MIFVDTSALFALLNPRDEKHEAAKDWFKKEKPRFVLTDYIVDELLTLAISRVDKKFALTVSKRLSNEVLAKIEKVSEEDFYAAWKIFDKYQDKEWSLTDCASYVFIKRLGIRRAFAFDSHFVQFDNVLREPAS